MYILDHAIGDERPYLNVDVLGRKLLGLLDSGASTTVIGSQGWTLLKDLGLKLETGQKLTCRVANGQRCEALGHCMVPFRVRDRLRVMKVLVIPQVPHTLILGADFWKKMGIVPDLRHNEWYFSNIPETIDVVDHIRSQPHLTRMQQTRLNALLERNLALIGNGLGCTDVTAHVINATGPPIKQRYYPLSPVMQAHVNKELDEMMKLGVIEKSKSPWSSPIVLVKKKNGDYRFCVDFRKLNAVTEKDGYPLPYVNHTLDKLKDAHYLSTVDIKSAYWQVPVSEESRKYTAFTVPGQGLFQFRRMPFGLHNAPATWQRLIDSVLGPELEPYVLVYLDDIVIVTKTFEEHLKILEEVFKRLRDAKLTISIEKCHFCRPELKYLGYVVDKNGLHCDPDKVKAMLEIPPPNTVKEVRSVIGTFSWYRRFIPDFSTLISPLTALLKKNRKFVWTEECETAFHKIKECLVTAPILNCPDYDLPFVVQTDASGYGLGAVLTQPHPDGDRVISYLSRSLTRQERNFSTTERECLAVLWAIEKLRPYLEGVPFTVITDHYSLVWLQNLQGPSGRLARWAVRLQQYDFKIVHRKGKNHIVPDTLSRSVPVIECLDRSEKVKDKWYCRMVEGVTEQPLKYPQWRVTNGLLFKYIKTNFPELSHEDNWKQVVPREDRKKIVEEGHNPPTSGHMGVLKTFSRIAERFYWPKMKSDVAKFVRFCKICGAYKGEMKGPKGLMTPQPRALQPWEIISTDLIGPLPRSLQGNQYILVVTDHFSKFSLTFPLRKATAKQVSRRIEEEVFLIFGAPRTLMCDNGPQYRSAEFSSVMSRYGVSIRFNANYHPQANPTERYNRTLKTMLGMYVADNHRKWDISLAQVTCATRTAVHESTKHTPYYVNFGRNMILDGKVFQKKDMVVELGGTYEYSPEKRQSQMKELFEEVRRRLDVASQKSQKIYDLRRRAEEMVPGQVVWKKDFSLSDASKFYSKKLAPKFVGPFLVKKQVNRWMYELVDMSGNSKGIWSIKDLKLASANENLLG